MPRGLEGLYHEGVFDLVRDAVLEQFICGYMYRDSLLLLALGLSGLDEAFRWSFTLMLCWCQSLLSSALRLQLAEVEQIYDFVAVLSLSTGVGLLPLQRARLLQRVQRLNSWACLQARA